MQIVTYRRHARQPLLALLSAVCVLFSITLDVVQAQSGVTLTVQLRDTSAQPLAGSTVRVIDAASGRVLAEADTAAGGSAAFPALRPGSVRVAVAGVLPDGTPLRQVGFDAAGISVEVPPASWTMTLLVDTDGTVFPELSLDGAGAADGADHAAIQAGTFGSPATATPTLERQPLPTAAPASTQLQPTTASTTTSRELMAALGWMAVFCIALALVIVYGRRP